MPDSAAPSSFPESPWPPGPAFPGVAGAQPAMVSVPLESVRLIIQGLELGATYAAGLCGQMAPSRERTEVLGGATNLRVLAARVRSMLNPGPVDDLLSVQPVSGGPGMAYMDRKLAAKLRDDPHSPAWLLTTRPFPAPTHDELVPSEDEVLGRVYRGLRDVLPGATVSRVMVRWEGLRSVRVLWSPNSQTSPDWYDFDPGVEATTCELAAASIVAEMLRRAKP